MQIHLVIIQNKISCHNEWYFYGNNTRCMSLYVAYGKQHIWSFLRSLLAELYDHGWRARSMVTKKEPSGLSHVFANTYTYYPVALNLYIHPLVRVEYRANEADLQASLLISNHLCSKTFPPCKLSLCLGFRPRTDQPSSKSCLFAAFSPD